MRRHNPTRPDRVARLPQILILTGVLVALAIAVFADSTRAAVHSTGVEGVRGVVLETRLAQAAGISVGDTVAMGTSADGAGARTFVVAGTFTPPADPSQIHKKSKQAWTDIPGVESITGRVDRLSRVVIGLAPGADADSLVMALNRSPFGYRAHESQDVANESSQTFAVISNFHKAISTLSILAGAVFLASIVLLQVQELRKSLGVLRVIGVSRLRIFSIVVGETLLLANIGAAIGVGVAFLVSRGVNTYYQHYFDTDLIFSAITGMHVALAFAVASVVGLGVGFLATAYLFKLDVTEVLGR